MSEEELRQRIKSAILVLNDGHTYKVGDLTFKSANDSHFSVTGWTLCHDLKNVSKQSALIELADTKALFHKMTSVSPDLSHFIKGKTIQYSLGFEYGTGSIEICTEAEGQVHWTTELEN